ncbi:dolichyl-phosphate-mannose-protein mannosyltransferase [Cereibacter changlensis]|uniref:Dolichyl-phosphate-mannose-protein mannosyltransferase n=2 Tax=Cereibacter changlensis TaxID=402884 RepID=A0A2W7R734_9RHOB|nr:glycosyltransferase family 39 protein [Cereibacter changlensis]PZX56234.1 dolichyl-phosphate-mannose-protein mannosyltransferase [Cereibacter changlensis]
MNQLTPSIRTGAIPAPAEVPRHETEILAPKASRYLLVIPVINEGERIRRQLRSLHGLGLALDVAIADGGSTDGSLDLGFLRSCGVRALLTKRGPGRLSAQLRMAYAWGLAEGYDGILTVDGNGKDGLEALPRFIAALDAGFDYVQGSRYRPGGQAINTPIDRKLGGRLLHAPLLSLASGSWLTDTTNGFRGYSRRYLTDPRVAPFRSCFNDYNLLFYLSARAGQLGYRVTEIPVRREYPASGPVPTKMGSLASKLALVGELFRTALGGYHPDADRPLSDLGAVPASASRLAAYLLPLVFLLILVSRLVAILDAPDIWHDEAMLMANLPLASIWEAFAPLPYYAQAAPPGYLLLASAVVSVSGGAPETGLRLLSLAGSLAAAGFLALTLRRLGAGLVAPIALALVFLSPFGVRYGVEIKQYSFELMATCLLLYATVRAVQRPGPANLALLAVSGLLLILFSFAASVLLATLALAAVLQLRLLGRGIRSIAGLFAGLVVMAAVWHLTITAAATADQLTYFSFVYDKAYLRLPFSGAEEGPTVKNYLSIMLGMFDPFYRFASEYHARRLFAVGGVILVGLGLLASLRRGVLLPVACVALLGGLALLSLLRLYPILYTRHFIFAQPLVGVILAIGLATLIAALSRWTPAALPARLVAGFVVLSGGVSLLAGLTQEKQQVSEALAVIASESTDPAPLIYVGIAAQPILLYVQPEFGVRIGYGPGAFDPDFRKRGSTATLTTDYASELRGHDEIWMVETLVYDGSFAQVRQDLLPLEAAFGPCEERYRSGSSADLGHTLAHSCRAAGDLPERQADDPAG